MNYKEFNKIGQPLSVIGLGTWQFAGKNDWPNFNKAQAVAIIHEAIERGINFIDTAPVYGLGHSELVVGEALKGKRDKVFLATKCGLAWDDQNRVTNNLTRQGLFKEIDESLQRLKVDHIDLYQVHWPDPNTDIRETMEALATIKEQGKIKHIGVSNYSIDMMKEAMAITEIVSHQGLYNMLEGNAESYHGIPLQYRVEESLLPFLTENEQFFLPYSPLMQGLLAGKTSFPKGAASNNPALQGEKLNANLAKVKKITDEINRPIQEIALNWLIAQQQVGPIIAGCSSPDQLLNNLKCLEWSLTADEIQLINDLVK